MKIVLRITLIASLVSVFIVFFGGGLSAQRGEAGPPDHLIQLKSRHFVPVPGLEQVLENKLQAAVGPKLHAIIQLDQIPDANERAQLEAAGVKLLAYIPNKAWFASIPTDVPNVRKLLPRIRWFGSIAISDKISPGIRESGVGTWAVNADGTVNLTITFFGDVNLAEAKSAVEGHAGIVIAERWTFNKLLVKIEPGEVKDLAGEDVVQWITEAPPPKKISNDDARRNVRANQVQTLGLLGTDVDVGIWDGGDVDSTHDDFGTRVKEVDNVGANDHATHVAGTVGGDGTLSSGVYRGMAPAVDIISYYWDNNLTDHSGAIATYGIEISQNSWNYGSTPGWKIYGMYGLDAPEYDAIVRGLYHEKEVVVVFSAGNDQGDYEIYYNNITPPATAKNVITVGAINSNDSSMTDFSSWGPMDDGRVKPDVVAPGCQSTGDEGVTSTVPGDTYGTGCGTSMAAPVVSGVSALLIEQYRSTYTAEPLPSTVKAVLMHTARDLGNAGPDFQYGYGAIDALTAVDLIAKGANLYEGVISDSGSYSRTLEVPSSATILKVTLVWADKEAAENADPTLVNNLDLVVTAPDNTTYYPWVLDPANPSVAATTGVDSTNNLEQVFVASPAAGSWTIEVWGASVPQAPQSFSLVFSVLSLVSCEDQDCLVERNEFLDPYTDVHVKGSGLLASHPYHVAYYDAAGYQWQSHGVTSDTAGVITSLYDLTSNQDAAASPPDWHAVVYDDDISAPATSYIADDPNSVIEDNFAVQASAIPEFPAIITAIVVLTICVAIYLWLRRGARVKA